MTRERSISELLQDLVRFKTISVDHETNRQALNWVVDQLAGLPVHIKLHEFKEYPSMVISTQPTLKSIICLHSHIDVVDGDSNLFEPEIKGNRLYGRGTYDMKFALACYLQLMKELGNGLAKYAFSVMIPTDEERGGFNGAKALLEYGYTSDVCFSPDGGENWKFEVSAKGFLQVKLRSKGVSAHGSRPWLGKNAIVELMKFLENLQRYFPEHCSDDNHYHSTMNIGTIRGGDAINKVPDYAEALVDIRFIPEQPRKEIWQIIRKVGEAFPNIEIEEPAHGSCFKADPNNPFFQAYSRLMRKQVGVEEAFICSHGSSDARFFAERDILVIAVRPPGGGLHSNEEWIELEGLERFYSILKQFVVQNTTCK